jgi:membrane-bound lytic murein transglycosylase A
MLGLVLGGLLLPSTAADAKRGGAPTPLEITNSQYEPLKWSDVPGWADDDQLAAFQTFLASCKPIVAQRDPPKDPKALGLSLQEPCRAARAAKVEDSAHARAFFERHFSPLRISKLGDAEGFVTGYYEPVVEGSRTYSEQFPVPLLRRPSNLFVRGVRPPNASLPNKGEVFRKIGRRKLVPYYDRAQIEDGILAGRALEICYVRNFTELLFMQIQGSARIKLEDGSTLRVNYDAHNGQAYTPVGRILIERGIVSREEMSMQRIRDYMAANPEAAKELRRQNKAYVFFREVQLADKDEAIGAQGIPLTAGRSIAVDRFLHVYGTPFFIEANLPIESERSQTPFRRLMVSQDTGSAIIGPARADIYFGAGVEAGRVSGRLKHGARFIMLVPRSLDPLAAGRRMILPDARPSAKIARLFPPEKLAKEPARDTREPAKVPEPKPDPRTPAAAEAAKEKTATVATSAPAAVPLPQARPEVAPAPRKKHRRYRRW